MHQESQMAVMPLKGEYWPAPLEVKKGKMFPTYQENQSSLNGWIFISRAYDMEHFSRTKILNL